MRVRKKPNLFLLEFIIAMLFFSLSLAVCVRLFAASHERSEMSKQADDCVIISTNIAETVKSENGSEEEIIKDLSAKEKGEYFVIYYDEDLNETDKENAKYDVRLVLERDEAMLYCFVYINCDNEEIYKTDTKYFVI